MGGTNRARIAELEGLVRYHADLYFNQAKPELSDAEFDALVDELRSLDPDNPALQEVGSVPSYGKKVQHESLMGSLDKETTIAGVASWYDKHGGTVGLATIMVTPKIDGCFRHDSKVMMANGEERSISEIKKGMMVLTVNEKTGKTEIKRVLSTLVRKADKSKWIRLVFTGGKKVICTEDHLFLTSNRGWVQAKDLTEDDMFVEPEFCS